MNYLTKLTSLFTLTRTLSLFTLISMSTMSVGFAKNSYVAPTAAKYVGVESSIESAKWLEVEKSALDPSEESHSTEPANFQIMTDGHSLYFRIEMPYSGDLQPLPSYSKSTDGDDVLTAPQFDSSTPSLQIFIRPDASDDTYYHFALPPRDEAYNQMFVGEPSDYVSNWRHKIDLDANEWVVEATIPLKALDNLSHRQLEGAVLEYSTVYVNN